ncbi:glycosyltransferase family 2 protein [Thermocoleostomius sinensis]|uniref:Glycosyltransferase n=1 Tax=Thermocoleostomius sinensis A174 TaxID=2016057 RepID=A0A9E9C955_9CYAN|nr:glycosyltransferase [Thermocoleostomius sinensis]WAL59162.1 glycosyltransferase [Thermocoleostomius sinensis A174]
MTDLTKYNPYHHVELKQVNQHNQPETISVCICTMNRPDELDRCLSSIFQSADLPDEVIVSDDSSAPQSTQAVTAKYPAATYQKGPRCGLSANRNACLYLASSSHIMFVDDDVQVPPNFMATARRLITSSPDTIITGHEINYGGTGCLQQGRKVVPHNPDFWGVQRLPVEHQYQSIVINATIFPRTLLSQAKFDEKLRYGCDEIDMARHATALGYTIIYCDELYVHHYPSSINRQQYKRFIHASRFYTTTKAYWYYDRSRIKALIYLLLAPLQLVASGFKRGDLSIVWNAIQATITAYRYLITGFGETCYGTTTR